MKNIIENQETESSFGVVLEASASKLTQGGGGNSHEAHAFHVYKWR